MDSLPKRLLQIALQTAEQHDQSPFFSGCRKRFQNDEFGARNEKMIIQASVLRTN